MHPDIYSQWKMLQWDPPEFVRAPGGPPSNVAISHVRLGGRAAFMGKVGDDDFGDELVLMMNKEKVQTRAVKFDSNAKTACSFMKIKLALVVDEQTEYVLPWILIFYGSCMAFKLFILPSSKQYHIPKSLGACIFDPNFPLPMWKSRDETRELIKRAWNEANIIEMEHFNSLLLPSFDGVVIGTEDVLITPFTCDRTGSGDAVVAAIMRKLTSFPEMYEDEDVLERQLRFAIAAGIISQWTIGAVRGFPTESATQNLKEQVYVPSMW
ncbi:hypothetical protein FNV43_RR09686 [Rhamnella rubrinervis]|uniref:Carbohydrate kinase PfkB domain-containing protein n=1 Tax=Rhamnella rubrinervis TaxID=2594499 RepID=A0A8K0HBQ6_9ROSA|nr:hypothetical protein FNV43_RR09686 [Rhamnella rubrinervis]